MSDKTSRWEADGWMKDAQPDDWNEGEDPDPKHGFATCGPERFSGNTPEELVDELMKFCGVDDRKSVSVNCCDVPGRIDIERIENDEGYEPREFELADWKAGKIKLWAVRYSFQAQFVTRETVKLPDVEGTD